MLYLENKKTSEIVKSLDHLGKDMVYYKAKDSMETMHANQHESRRMGHQITDLQKLNGSKVVDVLVRQEAKKQARLLHRYRCDKAVRENNRKMDRLNSRRLRMYTRQLEYEVRNKVRSNERRSSHKAYRLTRKELDTCVRGKILKTERRFNRRVANQRYEEMRLNRKFRAMDELKEKKMDRDELEAVWASIIQD